MNRRSFLKSTAVGSIALGTSFSVEASQKNNPLPRWRGFNLLDFFSHDPANLRRSTTEDHFRWMQDWGFDFVRIPMAYPYYLDIDRTRNIRPEEVYNISNERVDNIDNLVDLAHRYGMHVSLNLHRAPGYCINAGFFEPFNLWRDQEAQKAFYWHWSMWAKRYRNVSNKKISFDLVNEPSMREDMNDQHSKRSEVPGTFIGKLQTKPQK